MSMVFYTLLVVLLIVAFYQDCKYRAITWFVFPLLAVVALLIFVQLNGAWKALGLNLIFVLVVMSCPFGYISLREKKLTNIFAQHFGLGDLLFFIAVCPLFAPSNFILFFI